MTENNKAAIELIEEWMADTSGYDEQVYPRLRLRLLEDQPMTDTQLAALFRLGETAELKGNSSRRRPRSSKITEDEMTTRWALAFKGKKKSQPKQGIDYHLANGHDYAHARELADTDTSL